MSKDLKYRFDEIITTIRLTPDEPTPEDMENGLVLPDKTRDLHEPELFTAILCQTFKTHNEDNDGDFAPKMCAVLMNSAMENIINNHEPNDDDLHAMALAINIAWAVGAGNFMFRAMGILAKVCDDFDKNIPSIAHAVLKGNDGAEKFGKLDPYRILSKDYDPLEMIRTTHPEMAEDLSNEDIERLMKLLRERGDNE